MLQGRRYSLAGVVPAEGQRGGQLLGQCSALHSVLVGAVTTPCHRGDHLSPPNWEAGSVRRGGGSVLAPEPVRTGIPGVGGWTGIPGWRTWGGAHPAWVYELLVAMAQAPRSLSALWGHKQELRVHLTLFQLLFLQKVRSAGGGADAEIQSAKICHPRSVGLCRSQEEG